MFHIIFLALKLHSCLKLQLWTFPKMSYWKVGNRLVVIWLSHCCSLQWSVLLEQSSITKNKFCCYFPQWRLLSLCCSLQWSVLLENSFIAKNILCCCFLQCRMRFWNQTCQNSCPTAPGSCHAAKEHGASLTAKCHACNIFKQTVQCTELMLCRSEFLLV